MFLKIPTNSERFFWTTHSKIKMRQYQLSEQKVLSVIKKPNRVETGIAPETIAVMQITGTGKNPKEIWVMYQTKKQKKINQLLDKNPKFRMSKITIISSWRFPGRTKEGRFPEIPQDVLEELSKLIKN